MSAAVISPVIPPALPRVSDRTSGTPGGAPLARPPLLLASLIMRRVFPTVYGLAAIDDRGRLADRAVMRALGWSAGLRLHIGETRGLLVLHAHDRGGRQVTGQGHLRLPALLRHRCGLEAGDRVLLVASPGQRQLIIYPPAALDALIAEQQRTDPIGGEFA